MTISFDFVIMFVFFWLLVSSKIKCNQKIKIMYLPRVWSHSEINAFGMPNMIHNFYHLKR